LLMTHRGGLSLSIIIWRIGGGGPSFLLPWGPNIILATLVLYKDRSYKNDTKSKMPLTSKLLTVLCGHRTHTLENHLLIKKSLIWRHRRKEGQTTQWSKEKG